MTIRLRMIWEKKKKKKSHLPIGFIKWDRLAYPKCGRYYGKRNLKKTITQIQLMWFVSIIFKQCSHLKVKILIDIFDFDSTAYYLNPDYKFLLSKWDIFFNKKCEEERDDFFIFKTNDKV